MIDIIPLPDDAMIINGQYDFNVDFTINQEWDDAIWLAIKYNNIDLESTCDVKDGFLFENSYNFQAKCISGVTVATIVVYYDSDFNPEECEACDFDDLNLMGGMGGHYCAYSIEIPCETMDVECGEPSAAPSGSFYPSSAPSESPTKSSSPSGGPSGSPSESPSDFPSESPSESPSSSPSDSPSASPSASPSDKPSSSP